MSVIEHEASHNQGRLQSSATLFLSAIEKGWGLDFETFAEPETRIRIETAQTLEAHVDTVVDSCSQPTVTRVLNDLERILGERDRTRLYEPFPDIPYSETGYVITNEDYAHWLRDETTPEQSERFLDLGLMVIDVGQKMKETTSISEYISLRRLENDLNVEMFMSLFSKTDRRHPKFKLAADFIRRSNRVLNFADSVEDFETDFERKLSGVNPTLRGKLAITGALAIEIVGVASSLGVQGLASTMPGILKSRSLDLFSHRRA
ncbi:MAG TPA: hypothetical protein VMT23_02120 [Candidatus Binatia bacterium]|nr:hypothetical protein [Candidatus Binatia bacterium]